MPRKIATSLAELDTAAAKARGDTSRPPERREPPHADNAFPMTIAPPANGSYYTTTEVCAILAIQSPSLPQLCSRGRLSHDGETRVTIRRLRAPRSGFLPESIRAYLEAVNGVPVIVAEGKP